jgi:uncharacterized protein
MSATNRKLVLSVLRKSFAICKLAAEELVPEWATKGQFFSVTRTTDELSIVAQTDLVPERMRGASWRVIKVHGPFELTEVGVLASLVEPLAAAKISVFTISTFDTDYLLTESSRLQAAVAAFRNAGHTIHEN